MTRVSRGRSDGVRRARRARRIGARGKGAEGDALGLMSSIVIGVASTAPGYSLAASLGLVVAAVGLAAPAIMWLAFVPMLLVATSYYYLNRVDPDCGTTFSWATKAFGPWVGWIGGWAIIVADIIVMANLADIAGRYTFLLFGLDDAADNKYWVMLIGVLWIAVMTYICYVGIEVSAKKPVVPARCRARDARSSSRSSRSARSTAAMRRRRR